MAHKENQKAFVVTFPLHTEKWQEDRIDKMMRMLTTFYNDRQRKLVRRYIYLSHSKAYKEAKGKGVVAFKNYMKENGFSQYGLDAFFKADTKGALYQCGLNSMFLQYLSQCAWSAWDKKLFGKGDFVKTDKVVNIFCSRNMKGRFCGFDYDLSTFTIRIKSTCTKKIICTIPFVVNKNSEYELYALSQKICRIGIVRKLIRSKYKYYVQFTFDGVPYNKGRNIGTGIVGIDPGPSKIAIVSDEKVEIAKLAPGIEEDERKTARLRRKLDRSRRATNPHMYKEDGTIIKGQRQTYFSKVYNETRKQLADAQRKLAAKRKIAHNELANTLLEYGDTFKVEANSYKSMQARAKATSMTKSGRIRSKKRYGKSINNRAPSEFLVILKNKLLYYPKGKYYDVPSSYACTQFDFTNESFTEHKISERRIVTSDGIQHNRDTLAAFNIKNAIVNDTSTKKKKITKSKEFFDIVKLKASYNEFCVKERYLLSV